MSLHFHPNPLLSLSGLLIGVLVGLTGMGGGSLMTPLLMLVFGFHPATAVGTDILHGAISKSVGAWRHLRLRSADRKLALCLSLGSVPGAIFGVRMLEVVRRRAGTHALDETVSTAVGFALVAIGVLLAVRLVRSTIAARNHKPLAIPHGPPRDPALGTPTLMVNKRRMGLAVCIGLTGGLVVGLTSVGSGTIIGLLLLLAFPLTARRMVGTDVLNASVMLWAAGVSHLVAGNVDLGTVGSLLIGSIPGVIIGAHLTTRINDRPLRAGIASIMALSGLKLLGTPNTILAVLILGCAVAMAIVAKLLSTKPRPRPTRRVAR